MESDKAFSEMAADGYVPYQMGCLADSYIDDGESTYKLVELGSAGLEGIFPDDYTFVGSEYYVLDYKDFPEEFSFNTHISRLELIGTNVNCNNHVIKGNWNFSVPVAVNKSQIAEIEVGKEEMGHTIDSVLVSPVMATIYTSYPDIYGDTVDYSVVVLGDKSDENIGRIAIYGKTDGITKVPREEFDNTISVYVIDNSILERAGKRIPNREDFEEYAIVKAIIDLQ